MMLTIEHYKHQSIYDSHHAYTAAPASRRRAIRSKIIPFNAGPIPRPALPKVVAMLTEDQKWSHCQLLVDMLDKLAYCRDTINRVTVWKLYHLLEAYGWRCADSGTRHSEHTPVNIGFRTPLSAGGRIDIANIYPRHYPGWYAGEYRFGWRANEGGGAWAA